MALCSITNLWPTIGSVVILSYINILFGRIDKSFGRIDKNTVEIGNFCTINTPGVRISECEAVLLLSRTQSGKRATVFAVMTRKIVERSEL